MLGTHAVWCKSNAWEDSALGRHRAAGASKPYKCVPSPSKRSSTGLLHLAACTLLALLRRACTAAPGMYACPTWCGYGPCSTSLCPGSSRQSLRQARSRKSLSWGMLKDSNPDNLRDPSCTKTPGACSLCRPTAPFHKQIHTGGLCPKHFHQHSPPTVSACAAADPWDWVAQGGKHEDAVNSCHLAPADKNLICAPGMPNVPCQGCRA